MTQLIVFVVLVVLGYVAGTYAESKHYRSIQEREKDYLHLPAVTLRSAIVDPSQIVRTELVTGSVVISLDYFKRVLAALRNLFGGEVKSYESLLDRARREALLRMKEQALDAEIIINTRIETSAIGSNANQRKTIGGVEAVVYGTAVYLRN